MMRNLQDELALSQAENMRLRSELDGARDNYAALSRNSREDKLRMAADNERMNTLITKLDASVGVAAEGGAAGGPGGGAAASAPTASSAAPPFGASVLGAPPFDRLNVPPFAPAMAPDAELLPPPALGLQMIPSAPRSPNRSPKGAAVLGVSEAQLKLSPHRVRASPPLSAPQLALASQLCFTALLHSAYELECLSAGGPCQRSARVRDPRGRGAQEHDRAPRGPRGRE